MLSTSVPFTMTVETNLYRNGLSEDHIVLFVIFGIEIFTVMIFVSPAFRENGS